MVVEGGVSVINKMLQDLDRRQALGTPAEPAVVRPQAAKAGGHEWFWRVVAVLLAATLAWVAWVAVQLMPRSPVATEAAFQAAAVAKARPAAKKAAPAPKPPALDQQQQTAVAEATPAQPAAAPVDHPAAPASDALRLALELQTAVVERAPEPARTEPVRKAPAARSEPAKPKAALPPPAPKASVEKRERTRSAAESAEAQFRRAALLLNHGRVTEAEDQLVAALLVDPSHTAARQAYVALLIEQQRVDVARRVLQDALAADPAQATFALALARIHASQRDYAAALEVMHRAGSVARNADFLALRGAVLQRLSRHGEAVEAYQDAVRGAAQPPATWVGLGISLEALGRRAEAAQAYRRSLASGPMAPETREYAESRAKALE